MRWADERYVRLYTRDTVGWKMLPWQGRALLPLILRKVDRAGILELGEDGVEGLSALLDMPMDVVQPGLEALLKRGVLTQSGVRLVVPNFLEAQEATSSGAQRQREHRAKARDLARAGLREDERQPVIYFVQAENGGPVKVGYAQDLAARLVGLQTSHPEKLVVIATMTGDESTERELHARFAHLRVRGEWFSPGADLMAFVRSLASPVTARDTSRNDSSPVTPNRAVPSRAEPCLAEPPRPPAGGAPGPKLLGLIPADRVTVPALPPEGDRRKDASRRAEDHLEPVLDANGDSWADRMDAAFLAATGKPCGQTEQAKRKGLDALMRVPGWSEAEALRRWRLALSPEGRKRKAVASWLELAWKWDHFAAGPEPERPKSGGAHGYARTDGSAWTPEDENTRF